MSKSDKSFAIYMAIPSTEKARKAVGCKIGATPFGTTVTRIRHNLNDATSYKLSEHIVVKYYGVNVPWKEEEGAYHVAFVKNMVRDFGKSQSEWFKWKERESAITAFIDFAKKRRDLFGKDSNGNWRVTVEHYKSLEDAMLSFR